MKRFHWQIVQEGSLPLRPDSRLFRTLEHRPTSTLLWPENELPTPDNTVLTDPHFTDASFGPTRQLLLQHNLTPTQIAWLFVTHEHGDHLPRFPESPAPAYRLMDWHPDPPVPGLRMVPCPGHAADLYALVFTSVSDEHVWIVGDAILDEPWLRAWRYYWPNGYLPGEIIQTWRSVAAIFAEADVIVPGHGPPIRVTKDLVDCLIADFPRAEHASECPDVADQLQRRAACLAA